MSQHTGRLNSFARVTVADFEFDARFGNRPKVVCLVVQDFRTGEVHRFWRDDLLTMPACPFPIGPSDVLVAFYASAELGCMLELGWQLPANVIDLFAEHRVETNGLHLPGGNGLLGSLAWRGQSHIDVAVKDVTRDKILNDGVWSPEDQKEILDYCESDVRGTGTLLTAMLPTIDVPRALLRGRYMAAVARVERAGIPIDLKTQRDLIWEWQYARDELIRHIDSTYGVYEGTSFKRGRFSEWLRTNKIPWPRTENGGLALDDETFKEQALVWPILRPLRELRQAVSRMYLADLQVGEDGRSRTLLAPFASKTGRNQPSAKRFAFGLASWQRGVVKPPPGWALAYVDFASQEIGVAGGLSGDERLIDAYRSGDPYLAFGKQAGVIPLDATKESHPEARAMCKAVVLGLNYGLGAQRMAYQAGIAHALAVELIARHRKTYSHYWRWNDDFVTSALLSNEMRTVFGWRRRIGASTSPMSLMNFPMQANGAEMMRLAAIAATEAGIQVCAPVHDAFLIAAPLKEIDDTVHQMQRLMSQAGQHVCGVKIRTDAKIVRYPDRYMEDRGIEMWNRVMQLVGRSDAIYGAVTIA